MSQGPESPLEKPRRNWRDTPAGRAEMKNILERSGVPLEVRASRIVAEFCRARLHSYMRAAALGPVAWRETEESAYRELDGAAVFQESLVFDDIQVSVSGSVLIEVKYRQGIEYFAFAGPQKVRLPLASNASFSETVARLYRDDFPTFDVARLTGIRSPESTKGASKRDNAEENICYNVAASIADVVRYTERSGRFPLLEPVLERVTDLGLVRRFNEFVGDEPDWRPLLTQFFQQIPPSEHSQFLSGPIKQHHVYLKLYVPMLVVNGPITFVDMSLDGTISGFRSVDYVLVGERLASWPPREPFVGMGHQFPLLVVSIETLERAMEWAYDCALKLREAVFKWGPRGSLSGLGLEAALTQAILASR